MSILRDAIQQSLSNQADDNTTTPISIRLPIVLSNQLDELSLTLDRSKSFLINEFIKAGIKETNALLAESSVLTGEESENDSNRDGNHFLLKKSYMLNTNYNNDKSTHFEMLENQEAAAFCNGWKGYICQLAKGDKVYLYQSGVGIVAVGTVEGELEKSEYDGVADNKYSKKLKDFKIGFKAISARRFKDITGGGANFRRTMVELTSHQSHLIDEEIKRLSGS